MKIDGDTIVVNGTQPEIPSNPIQTFSVAVNNILFTISTTLFHGITYCTIEANGETLCSCTKTCANCFILSRAYEDVYGNFVFMNSVGGEYPDFMNFNNDNTLTYFPPESMREIRSTDESTRFTSYLKNYRGTTIG